MDLDATADLRHRATDAMIEVDTINPTELLRRFEAPQLIDYLSLDVEGAEYEVLSALDLGAYSIALMTIEHNHVHTRQEKIRAFLSAFGYEVVQNRNDDFFFHRGHLARLADGRAALPDHVDVFRDVYGSYREPKLD